MDASEIELYVTKLAEVELALSADPDNVELQTLKSEIEDLLQLSSQLQLPTAPNTAESTEPKPQQREWHIGDECEAKYSGDGKFYSAKIVSAESASSGIYQVSFTGYEKGSLQTTRATDMRENSRKSDYGSSRAGTKDGRIAKKKGGKDREGGSAVASGQQAWLKFAKGGSAKKLKAKAINEQSIFKSPDNVGGKVGVSNSGKGMAKNPSKTKF
ncbi:hypothetical protein GGI21_001161 [Coemansia aciculifera]|uniref:Uncharacterized protein n=1 Tax=Coemansia aciculifera TaxID=417176 RepID=A0ACC1LZV9_9FUNG|nr:hypothetical protein IWW38_004296 [Coemansia aciculifera]KAJ2910152.1 hypothetical protein GGI21_001161 [Coemansia aciculifera]